MHTTLIVFLCSFAFIGLKSFQARNIAFLHYRWILPISYGMGFMEVCIASTIAVEAVKAESLWDMSPYVNAVALGGGLGSLLAMFLHSRFLSRKPAASANEKGAQHAG